MDDARCFHGRWPRCFAHCLPSTVAAKANAPLQPPVASEAQEKSVERSSSSSPANMLLLLALVEAAIGLTTVLLLDQFPQLLPRLLLALPLLALCLLWLRQSWAGPPNESTTLPPGELPESQRSVRVSPSSSGERAALVELRKLLRASLPATVLEHGAVQLEDDGWCGRFLVSSGWQPQPAASQVADTMRWRAFRRPIAPLSTAPADHLALLRAACATGTIVCPGTDIHGRAVICIDNSAAPVGPFDGQVRLLAFTIEFALRQCVGSSNKICYLFKLGSFSTQNQPSLSESLESVRVLTKYFPQTIGSAVLYRPPLIFTGLFQLLLPLVDTETRAKIAFINGDVRDGSANDLTLCSLIGPQWKQLTGAEAPVLAPGCSPGFEHAAYWASVLRRERVKL